MAKRYKAFKITGVANDTAWDKGITSTKTEKRKLLGLLMFVTGQAGNQVLLDLERERFNDIYDYHIDTDEQNADANTPKSTTKLNYVEVDEVIEVGQTFKAGLKCGTTNYDLYGEYVYELV